MQQHSGDQGRDSIRAQRTQPALPGMTMPTMPAMPTAPAAPGVAQSAESALHTPHAPTTSQHRKRQVRKGRDSRRGAFLQLLALGGLLELLYLALFPLLVGFSSSHDAAMRQALPAVFPWVKWFYWTAAPLFVPLLGSHSVTRDANLALVVLACSATITSLAVLWGRGIARSRALRLSGDQFLWIILALTCVFCATMLCIPVGLNALSQDTLLYGLYGRVVVVYHANPYAVSSSLFAHDAFQQLVGVQGPAPYGPVWIDVSLLVTGFTSDSIASTLLGFRLLALMAHLTNTMLIWTILSRLKPAARLPLTLLYAWNPLVLLLGVCYMHLEIVVVLFLLLAVLFFQRSLPALGWVFVLLVTLTNPLYILLLPLFLRMMSREVRILHKGRCALWWLGMAFVSFLVLIIAYTPYWHDWGLSGLMTSLQASFLPATAINSLDAALLNLPLRLSSSSAWLTSPDHWAWLALVVIGGLLLFGLWLADTLELVLLVASWLLMAQTLLLPLYWPWYVLPALVLAICSADTRTITLAVLLSVGALASLYCWLLPSVWIGQALVTIGLPLVSWGWIVFFNSSWYMTRSERKIDLRRDD